MSTTTPDPRIPAYIVSDLRESIRELNACNQKVHDVRVGLGFGQSWASKWLTNLYTRRDGAWFTYRQSCEDLRANGIDPMPLVLALGEEVAVPLRGCLHERRAV